MPDYTLRAWIARQINIRQRLERVCACYLLFLMVVKWTTIRMMTNGAKAKRMEFRIRHTMGYLRYVGQIQLVCSEPKK